MTYLDISLSVIIPAGGVCGNHLTSRSRKAQRRELMCRVIAYSIGRVNLATVEEMSK